MKRVFLVLGVLLLLQPHPLWAETIQVNPQIFLTINLPSSKWVLSRQAPAFFVEQTRNLVKEDMLALGKDASPQRVQEFTRQRLEANEAYVFNPASGAILTIDFSPLRPGEEAPLSKDVSTSSRFALESLQNEKGVRLVQKSSGKTDVKGARLAYRIEARYVRGEQAKEFIGIVGYLRPCWFFFYYNDSLKDPGDLGGMKKILRSIVLKRGGGG